MGDQIVAQTATYTTHNKHKRQTSMSLAGFEPAIPGIELLQIYATPCSHRDRPSVIRTLFNLKPMPSGRAV